MGVPFPLSRAVQAGWKCGLGVSAEEPGGQWFENQYTLQFPLTEDSMKAELVMIRPV